MKSQILTIKKKGTTIQNLQVTKVVDGDTIKVLLNDKREFIRMDYVDAEESYSEYSKPVTDMGKAASEMAIKYFILPDGELAQVDLEFDTDDPVENCLEKYRDHQGRLIAYVNKNGENFNIKLIREGWSPYFIKYGNSRLYHQEMIAAEIEAQANNLGVWNPQINRGKRKRNYNLLVPWWSLRASIVDNYRTYGIASGVLEVRLDFPKILAAARAEEYVTVFYDLQGGVSKWLDNGALIYDGTKDHRLKLWIPNTNTEEMKPLLQLLKNRYFGLGRGYVYITGQLHMYRDKPEIILSGINQLSDFPPTV
ncbi:MAG: thermonuclease family protein [Okeania sp. SIO2C2]|uniref:thermonuclease family protein n=1 Tax=Okeania sp. SIO2C2 TaxID=2607787 RepID=UPI0013BA0EA3|nr:thermonuclease family protein [Okeania sp. SIO2C2]NEP88037.1 thermonuclease family protein [Okeania sp. SIO2C2]